MLNRGDKIILATNNKGKIAEIEGLLHERGFVFEPIGNYTNNEPAEDSGTYLGNALIKAKAACEATGFPALAEDSGIEFDALKSWPAVETAPWITSHGGWAAAMKIVDAAVRDTGKSGMVFRSTYVLYRLDGTHYHASAALDGTFIYPPRGENGFGHDPYFSLEGAVYFAPNNGTHTLAEMTLAEKMAISPRTAALHQLFNHG